MLRNGNQKVCASNDLIENCLLNQQNNRALRTTNYHMTVRLLFIVSSEV